MINILYCNHILHAANRPHIVSAGSVESGKCHLLHPANLIKDVDEPNYDGSDDFITADSTHVHSGEEWFQYLKKYCPKK